MLPPDFLHELRRAGVEVRADPATRILYSTDASIYQIEPLGVAFPRNAEELAAAVELAVSRGVPLLPRGAGSSLAGQAVGAALVLDLARHLTAFSIDPQSRTAAAQPGAVLGTLNRAAARHGLRFGPDPASADRAAVGGVVGNNASGAHSIRYGMTADHLLAVDVLLADGRAARFERVSLEQARRKAQGEGVEAALYRFALETRARHAETIRRNWPRVWRRASGYNLNYLLPWSPAAPPRWEAAYPSLDAESINLAPLFAGSEGTLGVIQRVTLALSRRPRRTLLALLRYPSVAAACDDVPRLMEYAPAAVELLPGTLLRRAASIPAYARLGTLIPGDPEAVLLLEFSGDALPALRAQARRLGEAALLLEDPARQRQVWQLRKVGLGLLQSRPGRRRGQTFIEDVAVPVARLGEYVRAMERLLAQYGTQGVFYAHASAGCLHMRPLLDLTQAEDVRALRAIAAESIALAARLGGVASGEHGDGLARSEWLERQFGADVMGLFRALKRAADPQGLFNPGKVVDAPPMDANLRYGVGYRARGWDSALDFSSQNGLVGAIEQCNGAGVCRKETGVMCPSFQAAREEMHSTRGRANLLRALISGRFPVQALAEEAAHAALETCLACKGCKAECPSGVDMAKVKYAFWERYYRTHRRPARDYLFAYFGRLAPLGARLSPLTNALLGSAPARLLAARLGIAPQRAFPKVLPAPPPPPPAAGLPVLYLPDAFTRYTEPWVERAALETLRRAGLRVRVLDALGAARPLISKGFLPQARAHLRQLLDELRRADPAGEMPILGAEPSELYTLRDELPDFFPGDPEAQAAARRAWLPDEFLLRHPPALERLRAAHPGGGGRVLLHTHCFQKARPPADDGLPVGGEATRAVLEALGYRVETVEATCCGMAGAFGYEAEHYELSMQIGELRLFPAARAAGEDAVIAATGASCRHQIADGAARDALHPLQLCAGGAALKGAG